MRKTTLGFGLLIMLVGLSLPTNILAQAVHAKLMEAGAFAKMSGVRPRPLDFTPQKPDRIKKLPEGIEKPLYGRLTMGNVDAPTGFDAVMDSAADGEPCVWIDTNGNGDLTDDPPIVWKKSPYPSFNGPPHTLYTGSVVLPVRYGGTPVPLRINLLRYDPNDPSRDLLRNTLMCLPDYAREFDLTLGAKTYHALLVDILGQGDFRGKRDQSNSGVHLYIDVNGNGQFDARGEIYDAAHPFTIKGVTYELANIPPDGANFNVIKSRRSVPEVLPPPDLRVGKTVPAFTQKRLDGKPVHFPQDYKGKIVLLYFWASYCPDCSAEIPFVRNAYKQFHERGLDILGISVDPPAGTLTGADGLTFDKYIVASHITWPQVYEGKWMEGDIPHLYFIQNIPTPFLVDGTTGKILATGDDLKGAKLATTLQNALTQKKE